MSRVAPQVLKESEARHELHKDHKTSRPLSDGYELVGLAGEFAWAQFTGMSQDMEQRPGGDSGVDNFIYLRYSVDVKTARKAIHLIHEVGKPFADIFVLCEFCDIDQSASLVGWHWGQVLSNAPTRDFGYGIINHYIHRSQLKPMEELASRRLKFYGESQ